VIARSLLAAFALFETEIRLYFSGNLGVVLGALLALLLVIVAWWQLSNISGTEGADFIHRLTNDLFTDRMRTLIHLIDCGKMSESLFHRLF